MKNTYEVRLYERLVHSLLVESELPEDQLMEDVLENTAAYLEREHSTETFPDFVEIELVSA